jgi:hypothetical protein
MEPLLTVPLPCRSQPRTGAPLPADPGELPLFERLVVHDERIEEVKVAEPFANPKRPAALDGEALTGSGASFWRRFE